MKKVATVGGGWCTACSGRHLARPYPCLRLPHPPPGSLAMVACGHPPPASPTSSVAHDHPPHNHPPRTTRCLCLVPHHALSTRGPHGSPYPRLCLACPCCLGSPVLLLLRWLLYSPPPSLFHFFGLFFFFKGHFFRGFLWVDIFKLLANFILH